MGKSHHYKKHSKTEHLLQLLEVASEVSWSVRVMDKEFFVCVFNEDRLEKIVEFGDLD